MCLPRLRAQLFLIEAGLLAAHSGAVVHCGKGRVCWQHLDAFRSPLLRHLRLFYDLSVQEAGFDELCGGGQ